MNRIVAKFSFLFLFIFLAAFVCGQTIHNMTPGTYTWGCSGTLIYLDRCITLNSTSSYGVNCVPPNPNSNFNYQDNQYFIETICTSAGQCLSLNPNGFPATWGINAGDTFWVYAGNTATGTPLAMYTNLSANPTITLSCPQQCVTFKFHSDSATNCKGWRFDITCVTCQGCNPPTISQAAISPNGSTTLCNGGSVVMTVATAGLIYQWKNGGVVISGATNQSITASTAGSYTCDVSNSCGTTISNSILITTSNAPNSSDAIISANGDTTFCNGGNVVLTVATAGLNYQWKNTGSAILGATNQSFTASASGSYSCDVSNSCGAAFSNSVTVTVNAAPTVSQSTITAGGSTTFCDGGSVVLTVAATGLTYQWKKNGANISGATNQSFTVLVAGSYKCMVSNSCGSKTSNIIVVTVNSAPSESQANITAGGSTTICNGAVVELSVATAGLIYQWKKGNTIISGATLQSFSASKTASYKCNVSNSCGTTTSNSISVTQNPSPTVSVSQAPCSGQAVLLTCNSNPNTGITFQWKKGGSNLSGATNATFNATQNATYKCVVTITATGCSKTSAGSNVTITCKSSDGVLNSNASVYPNPTSEYFNVNTSQLNPQSVLYIYDLTGRLVESHQISGTEMKIGGALSNGIYFLKIVTNRETNQVIKLVKNF